LFADLRETLVALQREDSGQDLIEYALIAATARMSAVATALNDAFSSIGEKLKSYTR
jgi:Flp pilus assembly pilin Flp